MATLRSPPGIDLHHNSIEVYPLGLATDGLEMKARNKGELDDIENKCTVIIATETSLRYKYITLE